MGDCKEYIVTLYGYFKGKYRELKEWSIGRGVNRGYPMNKKVFLELLQFIIYETPKKELYNDIIEIELKRMYLLEFDNIPEKVLAKENVIDMLCTLESTDYSFIELDEYGNKTNRDLFDFIEEHYDSTPITKDTYMEINNSYQVV